MLAHYELLPRVPLFEYLPHMTAELKAVLSVLVEARRHLRTGGAETFIFVYEVRLFNRALFFFQAEDGIRDRNVTGVQTCALPIFRHTGISLQTEGRERAIPALRRRAGTARGGSVHGDSARALDVLMRARPPLIGTVASGGSSRSAMEPTGSSAKPPGSGSSPVPSADRIDAWTASLSGAHAVGLGTCPPSSRQSRPQGDPGTTVGRPRCASEDENRYVRSRPPAAMRRTRPFASPLVELRGQRRSAPRSLPAQRLELSAPARRAGPSVSRARTGRWCRSRGSGGWARTPPCPGRRRAAIRRPLAAPGATSSAGCPPHPWPAPAGRGRPCACIRGTRR